jgi:hypothetical protein
VWHWQVVHLSAAAYGEKSSWCQLLDSSKGNAMDFVTLLKRDHEKFLSIFHQIQRGFDQPDTPDRHQLFGSS